MRTPRVGFIPLYLHLLQNYLVDLKLCTLASLASSVGQMVQCLFRVPSLTLSLCNLTKFSFEKLESTAIKFNEAYQQGGGRRDF